VINIDQMVRTIRLKIKDTGKIRFSDAEIVDAINVALEALYSAAMRTNARAIQKDAVIEMEDGVGNLPYDYGGVVGVWLGNEPFDSARLFPSIGSSDLTGKYEIVGSTIRSNGGDSIFMRYCSAPPVIQDVEGGIPLPFFMGPYIWGMALASLVGEDNMTGAADKAAGALASSSFDNIAEKAAHI
jgi:hypothetical protein